MRLNVLFDHQIFFHQEYGGISRYVIELARQLNVLPELDVSIYGGRHHNAYLDEVMAEINVKGERVPRSGSRSMKALSMVRNAVTFFAHASRTPATHVHQTYYHELFRPMGQASQILTVYDMTHELFPEQVTSIGRVSQAKRRAVSRADHVISISESTKRDLIRLFDVPEEKVTTIPLGLSSALAAHAASLSPLVRVHDRPYLLFVGQRGGYKNFDLFMRAFASASGLRDHIDVLCFGGGALTAAERAELARLGLAENRVRHLAGGDDLLSSAYRHAEFLVYPSLYEGFGFPPLEAMAFGCPVACSNTSSLPEVVGNAAVTFDPSSIDDMTRAVDRLAGDVELRQSCRAAGVKRASAFTWQRCAELTRDLYRNTA